MLIIRTNPRRAPEKNYVFQVLFDVFAGVEYRVDFLSELTDFQLDAGAGKTLRMADCFTPDPPDDNAFAPPGRVRETPEWMPHPFETGTRLPVICGENRFEENDAGFFCGLDVFSSSFFMLSRWEECGKATRDEHDRFPAQTSLAHQNGFLNRPVVHEYLDFLWEMLQRCGFTASRKQRVFQMSPTHDVDHPLLWWSAGDRLRTLAGSLLKRGSLAEFGFWLSHLHRDPFDSFDWLMEQSEKNGLRSCFNFMGQRSENSDCFYPFEHPFVQHLIKKIEARGHEIGIHPSYESLENQSFMTSELHSVQKVSTQKITGGRQHYLRFRVPETWRAWADAGMDYDSSLGYPEAPGFRCGVCYPFPVFDVEKRRILPLWEKPLIAMDVTLALYQKASPERALQTLHELVDVVRKHRGEFVLLWHNSSLNDHFWRPWKPVYQQIITM